MVIIVGLDRQVRAAPLTVSPLFTFVPPRRPRRVHGAFVRSAPIPDTGPRSRRNTHMLRSFARRGGIVLAALALPVLFIGTAATATTPSQAKLASATLNGAGSTFQLRLRPGVIGGFKQQQQAVTINYQGGGSGAGPHGLRERVVDFAGTDAPVRLEGPATVGAVLLLPDGGRADHGVVQPVGREGLKLSAETIGEDLPGARSRRGTTPRSRPTTRRRSCQAPRSRWRIAPTARARPRTSRVPDQGCARPSWTLGTGSTVSWPVEHAGRRTATPASPSIVKDTDGADRLRRLLGRQRRATSRTRRSRTRPASSSSRRLPGPSAAAQGASINADLTYDPIERGRCRGVPDHRRRRGSSCTRTQTDAAKGSAIKAFLNFIYGKGQKLAVGGRLRAVAQAVC